MLVDVRQNELDMAEERFMNNVFGSTVIDSKTQWLLNFLNIDINKTVQNFENFMKPILLQNGMVDAKLFKDLVQTKYPFMANIIPSENFRLVDIADDLSKVINTFLKGSK